MNKRLYHILVVLTFFIFTGLAHAAKIGTQAPDFTLADTGGKPVTLSSFKGKTVVLNFWATSCPPCLAELPSLEKLHREMEKEGVVVIGIALDQEAAPVKEVIKRDTLTFPILIDANKAVYFDSYGLFGLPITLVINKNGTIVDRVIGETAWDSAAMKEKLRKLR